MTLEKVIDFPGAKKFIIASFTAIILLVILADVVVIFYIQSQKGMAAEVNISGRQRMLSQRAAFLSSRIIDGPKEERLLIKAYLDDTIKELEQSHYDLINGNEERGIKSLKIKSIQEIHFSSQLQLDKKLKNYAKQLRSISNIATSNIDESKINLDVISADKVTELLELLDKVVHLYQYESDYKMIKLEILALLSSICVILTAIIMGAKILSLVRKIKNASRQTT